MLPVGVILIVFIAALVTGADLPTQVHIALAGKTDQGDSNTIAVSWNTVASTATSIVRYGKAPGQYDSVSTGYNSAYYQTFHHHVVLDTLAPDTKYYYIVGDDVSGWSKEFSFTSAPNVDDLRGDFSFFVYGDLGVENGGDTVNYINNGKNDVRLIWHGGDVSYADDSFLHLKCALRFCYEDTYDTYMNNIEPWASQLPYMVTPGNHEADCHDPACLLDSERREKLSNFTAYNHRFRMPSDESDGVLNMHYSFNYGNVHFISIDSETGYPGANEESRYVLPCGGFGDQLTWLENDLIRANAERAQRPWIFAQAHRPIYLSDSVNVAYQTAIEQLLYKYGVDVYFSGHEHHYERNYPVYRNETEGSYQNPRATTHVLIGGAGNDEMHDVVRFLRGDPSPRGSGMAKVKSRSNPWTVKVDDGSYTGIGRVTIIDDDNLKFEYIRTKTNEVYDSFTLYRDHSQYIQKKV